MATDSSFVDYVIEQSRLGERMSRKKMFGEYALYIDGKVVAFACDNSLFVKPLEATAALAASLPQRPPYPGAKLYPVADEWLDDADRLRALLLATAQALPLPKPKTAKKTAKKAAKKAVKKAAKKLVKKTAAADRPKAPAKKAAKPR